MQTGFNPLLITTRHPFNFTFLSLQNTHMTMICVSHKKNNNRGFALIATISVMVLLVMVALAMLSLATIEQRSQGLSSAKTEAQANARLALMHAIGKLQIATGPDQRITTSADFAGKSDGTELASGEQPQNNVAHDGTNKGLSSFLNGTRYWTGVWRNRATNPGTSIYTQTPSSEHVDWLISGVGTLPSDPNFAVSASGQPIDDTKAVILAGKNTVGPANPSTIRNYISAPLISIGRDGKSSGRYAWWVGDEGIKARNNIRAEYAANAIARYEDLIANRRGWEAIPGYQNYPKPGQDADLEKVISDREMELVEQTLQGTPLQRTFHAATPYSIGLATNSLTGGLKVDLTHYLENGFASSATFPNAPVGNENIIPQSIAPSISGPKWRQLKDFYDVGKSTGTSGEILVQSAEDSGSNITIAPVITDLRTLFGAKVQKHSGTVYQIFAATKVAVSIANPYPYPLRWNTPLKFELKSDTPSGIRPSCIWTIGAYCQFLPQHTNSSACLNRAIMQIPPSVLLPGEARSYTIGQAVERPWGSPQVNINLVEFTRGDPTNFEHSIIQKNNVGFNMNGRTIRLDVRESTNSTQMTAELRIGTSSGLLRRIKSFECDNGYFSRTTRWLNSYWASRMTKPFGLQLFTFQISQPGADYASLLPAQNLMGISGSTLRTFADFNVRADHFKAPITSYNPPPYFGKSENSFALLPFVQPGGDTGTAFTRNLASDPLPWGQSPFGPAKTILFSFPNKLLSLGQLQHADLTADDRSISVSLQPGNAFANSYAPPLVKRHLSQEQRKDYLVRHNRRADPSNHNYYDIAYLLNATIWDRYFLSTIPTSGIAEPENPNLTPTFATNDADLREPQKAASQLGINGAFNINSTNKDAWIALLSSTRHLKHPSDGAASTGGAFFPRSLEQKSGASNPPTGDDVDSWSGYRRLTEDEVENLAEHIVRQVRLRGPFTSLAHFINRTLLPLKEKTELSRSGPLQAAIDEAALTVTPDRTKSALTNLNLNEDKVRFQRNGIYPHADIVGGDPTAFPNPGPEPIWDRVSADNNPGTVASILADRAILIDNKYREEQGNRSTGIPGWLTQADILQAIGPSISVRSDTFRIRAYGESVDPNTGKVKARAYCEAVVQRTPQYTDPTNPPEQDSTALTKTNATYGRKFIITSFRWLSPNEI
jgi:type II secretory pathway pseudopilin PulG